MAAFQIRSGPVTLNIESDDFTDPWTRPPTLVMLHGFGRSSAMWYRMVPDLARHFRVQRLNDRIPQHHFRHRIGFPFSSLHRRR